MLDDWQPLSLVVVAIAGVVFLYIGWRDFLTLKIANTSVGILLGLFVVAVALNEFATLRSGLLAGVVLFALGYVFWLLGLMGGGDAKLFLPAGLFLGWPGLPLFVIALLFYSVLSYVFAVVVPVGSGNSALSQRLREIRATRNFPYGVTISLATVTALLWQL